MYTEQIKTYEQLRAKYQQMIVAPMSKQEYFDYAEVLFSAQTVSPDSTLAATCKLPSGRKSPIALTSNPSCFESGKQFPSP